MSRIARWKAAWINTSQQRRRFDEPWFVIAKPKNGEENGCWRSGGVRTFERPTMAVISREPTGGLSEKQSAQR